MNEKDALRSDWSDVNALTRRVWIVREGVWAERVPLEPREYAALIDAVEATRQQFEGACRELRRVEAIRAEAEVTLQLIASHPHGGLLSNIARVKLDRLGGI